MGAWSDGFYVNEEIIFFQRGLIGVLNKKLLGDQWEIIGVHIIMGVNNIT